MPNELTLEDGKKLVGLARRTIGRLLKAREEGNDIVSPEKADGKNMVEKRGVFVTLKDSKDGSLRGCIGLISPTPLWDGVQSASALAAFDDPRFGPLGPAELDRVIIEVSVLTDPEVIDCVGISEYEKRIIVGRDGLIIFNNHSSGLLLPQVPVEEEWDVGQFLEGVCLKAGLRPEVLEDEGTRLMTFRCQVFLEKTPGGDITQVIFKQQGAH